jgi:hypothetical protein
VVSYRHWAEVVLPLTCPMVVVRLRPQNAMRESFARSLSVPATSTTLGVDYLVGGIVSSQGGPLVANHLAASILVD